MELAQDRVQWRALVSEVLNLRVLLPGNFIIGKVDIKELGCEDRRWMELAQDRVQWRALVILALNLRVLLPENQLINKMDLREENREDGKWMELALLPDFLYSSCPVSFLSSPV
jgi:hypothetical protein